MSPLMKKLAGAWAIKQGVEFVQERRQPRKSFLARMKPGLVLAALGGAGAWLYKTGRLNPVIEQAQQKIGGSSSSNGSTADVDLVTAPAAVTGGTSTGTASTSSSL